MLWALWAWTLFIQLLQQEDSSHEENKLSLHIDKQHEDTQEEKKEEEIDVQAKMKQIRNRLALKWLIIEWDAYFQEWQSAVALKKYLEFHSVNPEDELIIKKIAQTYSIMNKYDSAISYYKQISDFDLESQQDYITILEQGLDLSEITQREFFLEEIHRLALSEEDRFYYTTSIDCLYDFHACKVKMQNYLWLSENQDQIWNYQNSEKLITIRTAIENYRNFQINDITMKNTFLLWAWYNNGFYALSIEIWKHILSEKKDYKAVLKVVAQSYFNKAEFKNARKYLNMYNKIDENDPNIHYLLGISNTKLKDFVLANIFFNKALTLWQEQSLNVRRYMLQNFYEIGNHEKVLETFQDILEYETLYDLEDVGLAIYYHILYDDLDTALKIARKHKEIYPDEVDFYTYEGWILREKWELELAKISLDTAFDIQAEDNFLLMNLAYLAQESNDTNAAIVYFKKILANKIKDEFYFQAEEEIEKLVKVKNYIKSQQSLIKTK